MPPPAQTSTTSIADANLFIEQNDALQQEVALMKRDFRRYATELIQARVAEIDEKYADLIKEASKSDPLAAQQLMDRAQTERLQVAQATEQQAATEFEAQRAADGLRTSADIRADAEILAPKLEQARLRVDEQRTFDNWEGKVAGQISQMRNKREGRDQNKYESREANIIARLQAAGDDPEAAQAIVQDVNRISDPALRQSTIETLSEYGMSMPGQGGGYYQNPDGTFTVQLPDGSEAQAATEAEAKELSTVVRDEPLINQGPEAQAARQAALANFVTITGEQAEGPEADPAPTDGAEALANFDPGTAGSVGGVVAGAANTAKGLTALANTPKYADIAMDGVKFPGLRPLETTKGAARLSAVDGALARTAANIGPKTAALIPGGTKGIQAARGTLSTAAKVAPPLTKGLGVAGKFAGPVGGALQGWDIADDLGVDSTTGKVIGSGIGIGAAATPYGAAFLLGYGIGDLVGADDFGEGEGEWAGEKIYGAGMEEEAQDWADNRSEIDAARSSGDTNTLRALVSANQAKYNPKPKPKTGRRRN